MPHVGHIGCVEGAPDVPDLSKRAPMLAGQRVWNTTADTARLRDSRGISGTDVVIHPVTFSDGAGSRLCMKGGSLPPVRHDGVPSDE